MVGKYGGEDKLEFRQIVLAHIKRILELSSHELRDATREIITGNSVMKIEQEDTRLSYTQSIENLAFVLEPYFDEHIKEDYEECIEVINAFNYEIKTMFKEEYEEVMKETGIINLGNEFTIEMKVRSAKQLFIALNKLLHRNDYLKSSIYGEGSDEIAKEEDEDE